MEFIEYTTVQGDRLDLIAFKMYGNPHLWDDPEQLGNGILSANPGLPIIDQYEGGIKLAIPVIDSQGAGLTNNLKLPPWKR